MDKYGRAFIHNTLSANETIMWSVEKNTESTSGSDFAACVCIKGYNEEVELDFSVTKPSHYNKRLKKLGVLIDSIRAFRDALSYNIDKYVDFRGKEFLNNSVSEWGYVGWEVNSGRRFSVSYSAYCQSYIRIADCSTTIVISFSASNRVDQKKAAEDATNLLNELLEFKKAFEVMKVRNPLEFC